MLYPLLGLVVILTILAVWSNYFSLLELKKQVRELQEKLDYLTALIMNQENYRKK